MENENVNNLLLNCIYQNTSTAIQSIENCINDIPESQLKKEIEKELTEYKDFSKVTECLADQFGENIKDNNAFEKARLWTSIKMSTIFDKSVRHYAEMFFLGTNMGIVDLIVGMCDNKEANEKIKSLANDLLQMEEKYVHEIKKYIAINV